MKGYILYTDFEAQADKTLVKLFGRTEDAKSFLTINTIEPYFFIEEKDLKKVEPLLKKFKVENTSLKTFQGEPVLKIYHFSQTEINKLLKTMDHKIETYEADIKPDMRFLMDNNIQGGIEIQGEHQSSERIDFVFQEPKINSAQVIPKLKLISLDIECDRNSQNLYCIGLYGENYKKTFFITDKKLEHAVSCLDELDCLLKFKEEFLKIDPDIITGWNVIDFDLVQIEKYFQRHKISFDIGRTNSPAKFRIGDSFFRASSADIPGRQVLDGLKMIKDPFLQQAPSMRNAQFESYSLEDVAQEILKDGKLIKGNGKSKCDELEHGFQENSQKSHQKIADYNIHDCKLVYDILQKTKTVELAIDRSLLTGMPLDRLNASIAAFDSLYIRDARSKGLVSPTTHYRSKEERIKGGYVFSAKSGIFHNVLVFDFKSLYPSILCTFNIDPASHLEKNQKGEVVSKEPQGALRIESPNKEYFRNSQGILPEIIQRLHKAREKAKKEKNELASYAIKTTMNSFWGVMASPNCRYFSLNMANAITAFARWIIQTTAKKIEEKGYKVIYSDTDSVFVETNLEKNKANALGKELQEYVNSYYKDYVTQNYNRPSFLELQFEKQFLSMMIPQLRMKATAEKDEDGQKEKSNAAKKRYAGLVEKNGKEELEVTGLEAIRGDWTEAARDFQKELLLKAFHKEPIEKFIKDYIAQIRAGKIDEKLVYRKSIRKSLAEYTKTTPPHVKAARLLDHLDSTIIEYYITTEGPQPIQKLKNKIDYDHYIEKQIKPIASQILSLLGKTFEDVQKSSKQSKLF